MDRKRSPSPGKTKRRSRESPSRPEDDLCPFFPDQGNHNVTSFPKNMISKAIDATKIYLQKNKYFGNATIIFLGAHSGLPELCFARQFHEMVQPLKKIILIDYLVADDLVDQIHAIHKRENIPFDMIYVKDYIGSSYVMDVIKGANRSLVIGLNFAPVYGGKTINDIYSQIGGLRKAFTYFSVHDYPLICFNYREDSRDMVVKKDFALIFLKVLRAKKDSDFFIRELH